MSREVDSDGNEIFTIPSLREDVLIEAAELTSDDRDETYGDPSANLELSYRLFGELMTASSESDREMGEGEAGALMMACVKLARIAAGPVLHRDNYVDAAAYVAIAYECAIQEDTSTIAIEEWLLNRGHRND